MIAAMNPISALLDWQRQAAERGIRLLVHWQGSASACLNQLAPLLAQLKGLHLSLHGAKEWPLTPVNDLRQAQQYLGQEAQLLVVDATEHLDADALAALAGTLVGGGLLILITPPLHHWQQGNPWQQRLARLIQASYQQPGLIRWSPQELIAPSWPSPSATLAPAQPPYASQEQAQAVSELCRHALGRPRRPLVLTADRGRGKSTALGLACQQLLAAHPLHLVVAVPQLASATSLLQPACSGLEALTAQHWRAPLGGSLQLLSFSELQQHWPHADVLLVDEAASLALPVLKRLTRHYPKLLFATTLQGYEGTGRSFALRFSQFLRQHYPQGKQLHLQQPVRWASQDPLEPLLNQWLLLADTNAASAATASTTPTPADLHPLAASALAEDEASLQQFYGLLVQAHYRTRPSDLQQLLSQPGLQSYQLGTGQGALVTLEEGPLAADLQEAIWLGQRRPPGQLLPQSLSFHGGAKEAGQLRYRRIMRIAVPPQRRRQGGGRAMLQQLAHLSQQQQIDILGSSFGASAELVSFWLSQGYLPLRMGLERDASSAEYNLLVGLPLSAAGQALCQRLAKRFWAKLLDWLPGPLSDLEPEVLKALARTAPLAQRAWQTEDAQELAIFCHGQAGLAQSQLALHHLCQLALPQLAPAQSDYDAILRAALYRWSLPQLQQEYGWGSAKQALQHLRQQALQLATQLALPEP